MDRLGYATKMSKTVGPTPKFAASLEHLAHG